MLPEVIIDCFPESARRYTTGYTVVAVDVIRATTSAITAVASGRRCFTASTLEESQAIAARLENPLMVGELGGDMPDGFHMNNSPVELLSRTDRDRPVVLLSTSGTRLIDEAQNADLTVLACFRNWLVTARFLAGRFDRIALIGAGSRAEFREEDQMCCAWIGDHLLSAGYSAANEETLTVIHRWRAAGPETCVVSNSAKYLLRTGQEKDLDFVTTHINDLSGVFVSRANEVEELQTAATDAQPWIAYEPEVMHADLS
jgi:2-phosphosulfolactate phosphatase